MRYEVIGPDGKIKMSTTHESCACPPEVERAMKKAGYRIRKKEEKA